MFQIGISRNAIRNGFQLHFSMDKYTGHIIKNKYNVLDNVKYMMHMCILVIYHNRNLTCIELIYMFPSCAVTFCKSNTTIVNVNFLCRVINTNNLLAQHCTEGVLLRVDNTCLKVARNRFHSFSN